MAHQDPTLPPFRPSVNLIHHAMQSFGPPSKLFQPSTGSAGIAGPPVDATPVAHHTARPPKQLQLGKSCSRSPKSGWLQVGSNSTHCLSAVVARI
ncbi:hypothetical protein P170DRAFT_432835 [Aspergillus steynii IBT 23096]|uniref:Uncharacterized protein n=1 Tax=Aspergillus steynii IBT 23096 TaxID=1392250 RepID=A0A2I2GQZ0_9EURO|nr:uncharacterized protein P170DRAFT_432835 [Aspergillus steynii IBT 23096]PLB55298.1 hypothetical protein P170DRAFT_432835 [Aspergillus steynii IBT 23096]